MIIRWDTTPFALRGGSRTLDNIAYYIGWSLVIGVVIFALWLMSIPLQAASKMKRKEFLEILLGIIEDSNRLLTGGEVESKGLGLMRGQHPFELAQNLRSTLHPLGTLYFLGKNRFLFNWKEVFPGLDPSTVRQIVFETLLRADLKIVVLDYKQNLKELELTHQTRDEKRAASHRKLLARSQINLQNRLDKKLREYEVFIGKKGFDTFRKELKAVRENPTSGPQLILDWRTEEVKA